MPCWVLSSAKKEENCLMRIEGRESYKVNGSFPTRMQETTWLCASCLNGVVGLSRASLKGRLHQYLKGVIQFLADDSQVSVSTSYIFGLLLSCSITGFSSCTFTSRASFCWWYMPAKLNFVSQIKCISQSLKPRKSPDSPPPVCCSDEFLFSPAPHLHSTQHKESLPVRAAA